MIRDWAEHENVLGPSAESRCEVGNGSRAEALDPTAHSQGGGSVRRGQILYGWRSCKPFLHYCKFILRFENQQLQATTGVTVEEDQSTRSVERQAELERFAERLVVDGGAAGLSIERLAQEAGYSRPTVYRHFSSKEDALRAVILNAVRLGEETFSRFEKPIEGTRREQAMAPFIAIEQVARYHSNTFQVAELFAFDWMRQAAPDDALWKWAELVTSYFRQLEELIDGAFTAGELTLPPKLKPGQVAFHSINLVFGSYTSILKNRITYQLCGQIDPWESVRQALQVYWDGIGWQSLSVDHDYEITHSRILKQVFPEYWLRTEQEKLERQVGLTPSRSSSEPSRIKDDASQSKGEPV